MRYDKNKSEPPATLGTIAKLFWQDGYQANRLYVPREDCTHKVNDIRSNWQAGWDQADRDYQEND